MAKREEIVTKLDIPNEAREASEGALVFAGLNDENELVLAFRALDDEGSARKDGSLSQRAPLGLREILQQMRPELLAARPDVSDFIGACIEKWVTGPKGEKIKILICPHMQD
jgi:hypothetical protein